MLRPITEASDLQDKKVFVRVDWNVPIQEGRVIDDYRIQATLPTLQYLKGAGAQVTIATHLDENGSVEPLKLFVPEGMTLLENLREDPREVANDESFSRELASGQDIYVNEAFGSSHREHASIVGLPQLLPSYVGIRFEEEVRNLSKAFNPPHPFLFILGGAKFETKFPLVEKFLGIADEIAIFGANAKPAHEKYADNSKVIFPIGDIAALDFADEANQDLLRKKINNASFIVWNGPLGKYEEGYKEGTQALAKMLAESVEGSLPAGRQVIVGGADTLACIRELGISHKFSFVSTGGGAMLTYLAEGTLPGIEVLK